MKDYFLLAFGNLKHRGLRSWLTILGIFIGIAAVVSLISLGAGLQAAISAQFGTLSVDKLTIQNKGTGFGPPGSTVIDKLNDRDIKVIENVRGVKTVLTRLVRVVRVEYNDAINFNYAVDIPSEQEKIKLFYDSFGLKTSEGRMINSGDRGKILIGSDLANTKTFDKKLDVGKKIKISETEFEIAGILEKTGTFTINSAILIPREDMEETLGIKNEYDLIVVQVENKDEIVSVAKEIEEKLRRDRKQKVGEEDFTVETPLESLESVNLILNIVNLIVIGIAGISLFVGGVGIANTMYTSVIERTKEIGVMKAIGAKNSDVLYIFLIEAGLLGLVGGIVGVILGLGAAFLVSSIAQEFLGEGIFLITISYPLIVGSILFSFFIGVLSGILPALQASKLNVVDALRK